jgi:hypothetical protein
VDLVNQAPGIQTSRLFDKGEYKDQEDKFVHVHPDIHWKECLVHAQEIRLGTMDYELVIVK